jgi:two-component system, OmpR family, response regulator
MRVLVVEDEPKMAAALARGLRGVGYAVDLAHDGEEALFQSGVYEYDAVILDVMLPGADGFEVCEAMRRRGGRQPVLMLTARDDVDDRISGLDTGADDYLVKPFVFEELLARLRALIRRGPVERPARMEIGALTVDPARHQVMVADEEVALSPREFALLEFLAMHAGEVVSRTTLLEHVWDQHYPGSTNVVDVYVSQIRRKLDGAGSDPLIQTVRGVGFRLDAGDS